MLMWIAVTCHSRLVTGGVETVTTVTCQSSDTSVTLVDNSVPTVEQHSVMCWLPHLNMQQHGHGGLDQDTWQHRLCRAQGVMFTRLAIQLSSTV